MTRDAVSTGLAYAGAGTACVGATLAAGLPGFLIATGTLAFAAGVVIAALDAKEPRP